MSRTEILKKLIEENPSDEFSRYALALEMTKEKNYEEAEKNFRFLTEHSPEYAASYYQFGKLLEELNRTDEAIDVYKAGMEIVKYKNQKTFSELQSALNNLSFD